MQTVTLSSDEIAYAQLIGTQRFEKSRGDPRFAYSSQRSGIETHGLGCMGELAAAKVIGIPWPARINTFRDQSDLDPFWEVRWSNDERWVKVATDDRPNQLVCHVTGRPPIFRVHGFILAGWVQRNVSAIDLKQKGRLAHFVRADKLAPIDAGFHQLHAWHNASGWFCLFCGVPFD